MKIQTLSFSKMYMAAITMIGSQLDRCVQKATYNIQYWVEPISDRPEMYWLIPESALLPEKYVLYFDKTLHQTDMTFTASPNRRVEAYYFGKQ